MKRGWFYAGLVLSLAVNAGALGFYGVRKYRDWRSFQTYQGRWFKPGTTPRQLHRISADLDKSRTPIFDTLRTANRELGLLALEPSPDSARVNAALDAIGRSTREEYRLLRENMRALHALYRPEELEFWRNRMKVEYDSVLGAESSKAAESREGR